MKKVAFVCVLFLFFACKKNPIQPMVVVKDPLVVHQTTAFYIERDAATGYLGKETVKVTVSDTLINSICYKSFVQFQNLTQKAIKIDFIDGSKIHPPTIIFPKGGDQVNESLNLCTIFPCNTSECPNASNLIVLMKVFYNTTNQSEAFYVERDSTTAYFGKETVKVTVSDTLIDSICYRSIVQFENLAQTGVYINVNNRFDFPAIYPNNSSKINERVNLCTIFPCNTSVCPNASRVIPLMKVVYSTYVNPNTEVTKYIEKDSISAFIGQETLKLTRSFSADFVGMKSFCSTNLLEIENLTDKTVEVTIYNPLAPTPTVWKKIVIAPRQKAGEILNLQGVFSYSYSCAKNAQVVEKMKVTYN